MIAERVPGHAPTSNFFQSLEPGCARDGETFPAAGWFAMILDQIDYGIVAVAGSGHVIHANHAARHVLRAMHPLQFDGHRVHARRSDDQLRMQRAIGAASTRGLRALLMVGDDAGSASVAVVPIQAADLTSGGQDQGAALLVIGKQAVCEELSAQCFAHSRGLTLAEARVLRLLCGGVPPTEIAILQCVAVSTIRTQIHSIRAKTGARNIGALVRQVAALPPLVNALRSTPAEVVKVD